MEGNSTEVAEKGGGDTDGDLEENFVVWSPECERVGQGDKERLLSLQLFGT